MITRFSSRRTRLDSRFLTARLNGARSYDRIAGYFSSSIIEVAGEALESVTGPVRMVCNSALAAQDVLIAQQAAQAAMRREWCESAPENLAPGASDRFHELHSFLVGGKLKVRVLPDEQFGLIHGKAGVITLADGGQTAFLGSVNESLSAWRLNYELLWEDDAPEAVAWVQEEFDALWESPYAVALSEFVIQDIERLSRREIVASVESWRGHPLAAAPIIEAPVYRQEAGLWEHQKYFVKLAFDAHQGPHGARFVLADQVGLGKTLQLAMAAELMALAGDKPVLVLAPKPLIWQWQDELDNLLDMPSAVWDGGQWITENGVEYPSAGPEAIRRCPRRVGIV
ncbi:MAG: helicase SNF2, partial [Gammaproteobacteria bacterium]|nr:helicase SNF2 [Gammaproteobacteria bacterium]